MLPSSTVENYLKAIYQGQAALGRDARLVPMGGVAAALGVTPGTATTMVKALAESGLAEYEPYSGVRLTAAGEKLAGLVLRRHRLVELFLVQVMGMSWAEVHDEAEQLEHVVSERLIERIDQMLGRPTHDPHGDPIPDPEGAIASRPLDSLLTCPLGVPLRVSRVADQDPPFLRFIEDNDLKPGQPIEVETRDAAADAVRLRGKGRRPITIGARAASKLLVEMALLCVCCVPTLFAQSTAPLTVNPDRPDLTNGAALVSPGVLQIEAGGLYNRDDTTAHGFGTPVTARIGVRGWIEGRISTDGLLSQSDPTGRVTGLGNVQLAAKLRVLAAADGKPLLSILPSVNIPTASAEKGLGSGDADYTLGVLTGFDVGHKGHIDLNYGLGAIGPGVNASGGDQPHFAQHLLSMSGSIALGARLNPYLEGYWYSRLEPGGDAAAATDFGAIYLLSPRVAVDGGVQFGVKGTLPAFAVFWGVSVLIGTP